MDSDVYVRVCLGKGHIFVNLDTGRIFCRRCGMVQGTRVND